MHRAARFCLLCCLLFITAHRLPAPISEENPTPALEKSVRPRPKRVAKPPTESSTSTHSRTATAPAAAPIQNKFDGSWTGTLPNLPFVGNVDFTLFVTGNGTSVT